MIVWLPIATRPTLTTCRAIAQLGVGKLDAVVAEVCEISRLNYCVPNNHRKRAVHADI